MIEIPSINQHFTWFFMAKTSKNHGTTWFFIGKPMAKLHPPGPPPRWVPGRRHAAPLGAPNAGLLPGTEAGDAAAGLALRGVVLGLYTSAEMDIGMDHWSGLIVD